MASERPPPQVTLYDIATNAIILDHILPYLSAHDRLRFAATNRSFRDILKSNSRFFRYLDLSTVRAASFKDSQTHDANPDYEQNHQVRQLLTEDEFMSGPILGLLSSLRRASLLPQITTLILDRLPVPSDVALSLLTSPSPIRLLSLRAVTALDEPSLIDGLLAYQPPPNTPPKGLYIFTSPDDSPTATTAETWYRTRGQLITRSVNPSWAKVLSSPHFKFDAVLCKGPAHDHTAPTPRRPTIARYSLSRCAGCNSAPEGLTHNFDRDLPLLSPPPVLTSTVLAAQTPTFTTGPSRNPQDFFVARCEECVRGRMCRCCNKWFCETCLPLSSPPSTRPVTPTPTSPITTPGSPTSPLTAALAASTLSSRRSSTSSLCPESTPVPMGIARQCIECGFNVGLQAAL